MPGCSVPNCHRRADKGYRLFVFPKKPERRKLWTHLCNREDKPPPKHARMCEYHFDDNQFEKDFKGMKGKLKSNAIPTVFDVTVDSKKEVDLLKKNCVLVNSPNVTREDIIINPTFDYIKSKFVNVSQHDDNSFWKSDFNVNNLSFEENFISRAKCFNREEESFQDLNVSVEQLYVKPEILDDTLESIIKSENILESDNNNVQTITDRTKDLEEQLKDKDKELVKTQELLLKTFKQVERLKAQNEKLQTQISELSGESNSKSYSGL